MADSCTYIVLFLTLRVLDSDEGGLGLNHHQCVAPAWVMHGSHFSTRMLTTQVKRRGKEQFFNPIKLEMIRWQVERARYGIKPETLFSWLTKPTPAKLGKRWVHDGMAPGSNILS